MSTEFLLSIDNDSIKPAMEIGAFEAVWANRDISSYKQLREKLSSSNTRHLGDLIDPVLACDFYKKTTTRLHDAGIYRFGVSVSGTVDFPTSLQDAPLWLHYPKENADLYKKIAKDHLLISQVPICSYILNE